METIDVLQVRHTSVDTESIAYTYTLLPARQSPQPGSGVVRHRASRAELEKALLDAATDIRMLASGSALPAGPSFHALGTTLREKYLPDQVLAFLFPEHPTPLLIDTDDPEFPWEVVHDGTRFLGTYRQLGRQLPGREFVRLRPAHWGNHRQALLVQLLPETFAASTQEIEAITGILTAYACTPHRHLGVEQLQAELRRCPELLHCISHVAYNQRQRNASALVCADGALTAEMLQALPGTYAMVYIDGCEGARAGIPSAALHESAGNFQTIRPVEGLAVVFLAGGAVVFVSALWPIADTLAADFSETVYRQLAKGVSIGEALRWTRAQFLSERAGDPTWAAYVLYGDPRHTLATIHDPALPLQPLIPAHNSVPVPALALKAVVFRSPRVELFVNQYLTDNGFVLSSEVGEAVHEAIRLLDTAGRGKFTRLDLFAGLAAVPESICMRALQALGFTSDDMLLAAIEILKRDDAAKDRPTLSEGVKTIFARAKRTAQQENRTTIIEYDVLSTLLTPPSGSVLPALQFLRLDHALLLQTIRQIAQTGSVSSPLPPRQMAVHSEVVRDADWHSIRQDRAPTSLMVDVRSEIRDHHSSGTFPPFCDRFTETRAILRTLTRSDHHHALLIGPAGVGKYALAYHLATWAVTQPQDAAIAAIASWELRELRIKQSSQNLEERLRKELDKVDSASIVLLDNLLAFVQAPGVAQIIERLARHPQIRLIATVTPSALQQLERQHFALTDRFLPFELAAPAPAEASAWVAAHIPRLEQRYHAAIESGCVEAAMDCAGEEHTLVLPGAAITRLDRGCAYAVLRHHHTSALSDHAPSVHTISVTPADVHSARPELFVKGSLA